MAKRPNHKRKQTNFFPWLITIVAVIFGFNALRNNPEPPDNPDPEFDGVCFAVGNVANSPAPNTSDTRQIIKDVLKATEDGKKPNICMYSAASEPYAIELKGITTKEGNAAALEDQVTKITNSLNKAANEPATKSGANYFEAIKKAASFLKTNGSTKPLIVAYGSGLSDSGILDFAFYNNLFNYNSDDINKSFKDNDVEKDSFSDTTIKWYGIGEVVEENGQEKIDTTNINKIKNVYRAAFNYAGANSDSISFIDIKVTNEAKSVSSLWVNPTRVPGVLKPGIKIQLDEKRAKFEPNTATLVDRDKVINDLTSFAKDVNSDSTIRIKITGYHAKCQGGSDEILSKNRANAIKNILVSLGVDGGRIETYGVGGPQDDREEGSCSSAIASEHRAVIIEAY